MAGSMMARRKVMTAFMIWNVTMPESIAEQLEVVNFVVEFPHVALDRGALSPVDVVLHVSCHVQGRVAHDVGADAEVALLDVRGGLLQRLAEFHPDDYVRQPSPAEGRRRDRDAGLQALCVIGQAHGVELLQEDLCHLDALGIRRLQLPQLRDELGDVAGELVVLGVVLPVVDVVLLQDQVLSGVLVGLPVVEVHLLEQLLLMMFELPHAGCEQWAFGGRQGGIGDWLGPAT
mmetsp:Transcript_44516/g.125944  ORF Transcript_44516/g.125944 Transcript_44516/m.125944 type:complete len:232 (-) Transcript_44516:2-697(-)